MKRLGRKIKDKQFLKLIKKGLKAGILDKGKFVHSLVGTPQGGASPILFNIYMAEFDKFINTEIAEYIDTLNKEEQRKEEAYTKEYSAVKSKQDWRIKKMKKLKQKNDYGAMKDWNTEDKLNLKQSIKEYRIFKRRRMSIAATDLKKIKIRYTYVRYADDWILFTNAKREIVSEIEKKIEVFLMEK